jgi:hypothetical protein
MRITQLGGILVATLMLSGAFAVAPASAAPAVHVYVNIAPPVPVAEVRVARPGPGYVWTPGYHAWVNGAYVWTPGAWVRPPYAHAHWVPARWQHDRRHGYFMVRGHWRR